MPATQSVSEKYISREEYAYFQLLDVDISLVFTGKFFWHSD